MQAVWFCNFVLTDLFKAHKIDYKVDPLLRTKSQTQVKAAFSLESFHLQIPIDNDVGKKALRS